MFQNHALCLFHCLPSMHLGVTNIQRYIENSVDLDKVPQQVLQCLLIQNVYKTINKESHQGNK